MREDSKWLYFFPKVFQDKQMPLDLEPQNTILNPWRRVAAPALGCVLENPTPPQHTGRVGSSNPVPYCSHLSALFCPGQRLGITTLRPQLCWSQAQEQGVKAQREQMGSGRRGKHPKQRLFTLFITQTQNWVAARSPHEVSGHWKEPHAKG